MNLATRMQQTLFTLALSGLVALPASAEIGANNGEIGFDLGVTELDNGRGGGTMGSFSIRGGYHFSDLFELEGQVKQIELDDHQGPGDLTLTTFFVNAVFNFHPTEHIVPYVLVGLGQAETEVFDLDRHRGRHGDGHDEYEIRTLDSSDAGQIALGSRFFLGKSRRLALRIEASMMFEEGFDNNNEHLSFAGGLTWRLGPGRHRAGHGSTADTVASAAVSGRGN